jgi:type 1 fimbria pilin
MKILLLAAALTSVSLPLWAETTVEFKGTLVADPCQVATDSEEQWVNFGEIPSKTFIQQKRSSPKKFQIHLTECDLSLGNSVFFTFLGATEPTQPGTFAVTGEAEGIAIALEDDEGTEIVNGKAMVAKAITGEDVWYDFRAFVQSTGYETVKEGEFESVVTFSLEYE